MIRYTMTIDVWPHMADAPDEFRFVRAVLDTIEPGAGGHTLGIYPPADHDNVTTYEHIRLGVTIAIDRQEV